MNHKRKKGAAAKLSFCNSPFLLFQIARLFGDQAAQDICGAFGVEAVIGNAFFLAQLLARLQIAPQKRGDAHDDEKQRAENRGLYAVSEFVYLHIRFCVVASFAEKQKHTYTQAAALLPLGDDAAVISAMRGILMSKINNEAYQRLGESPSPLP